MPDLDLNPFLFNGGLVLLILCLLLIGLVALVRRPPVWRCGTCGAEYTDFVRLVDHEYSHGRRPRPIRRSACSCQGPVHHPSCSERVVREDVA